MPCLFWRTRYCSLLSCQKINQRQAIVKRGKRSEVKVKAKNLQKADNWQRESATEFIL